MLKFPLVVALLALPLTACDDSVKDGENGTTVSINASGDEEGDVAITADGNSGEVAVNVAGFQGKIDMPRFVLDNGDFDLDGVKLYPGSKIGAVNVNASGAGKSGSAKVEVAFTAPADPAKVSAYLKQAFAEKKITVAEAANTLSGTLDDGSAFAIALSLGEGGTAGRISIDAK